MTEVGQREAGHPRIAVTRERIVDAARRLLVEGGLESVTVREVARSLDVSAPALYKHLRGREEILDRLSAVCMEELTADVVQARDAVRPDAPHDRFVEAGRALRSWARAHPAEFALLFATPSPQLDRPVESLAHAAGLGLGRAFVEIAVVAASAGQLRARDDVVPGRVVEQLRAWGVARSLPLTVGQLWTAVAGYHELMGLVTVDAFGQLGFALTDTDDYMRVRIEELAGRLIEVSPGARR